MEILTIVNPLLSSISIGDGQEFRVADMFAIRSRVNLLVFAACLSGFGKVIGGSDVLGFLSCRIKHWLSGIYWIPLEGQRLWLHDNHGHCSIGI